MRTCLIVMVALLGCKKASPPSSETARTTKDADALWALAPEKMQMGFVITPRGLDLLEGGGLRLQSLLNSAPELAAIKSKVDAAIQQALGGPFTGLSDLGLDKSRGLAWFIGASGEPIVALPIADRAKFAKVTGQDVGTDPNKLGPMTCKTIGTAQVCSQKAELLATLGNGKVPPTITAIGLRGDIEAAGATDPIAGAAVVQVERGEFVAHVAMSGPPPDARLLAGAQAKPRVEANRSVAFMSAPITLFSQVLPAELPLPGGGTMGELLATVNGPVTVTIAAASIIPDVRVPVSDPAPAQRLVDHCKELLPPELIADNQPQGACRFKVPQYGIELDAWTEAHELRLGAKQPATTTGPAVALTPLGKEIADQAWAVAFWGRGSLYAANGFPALGGQNVPDQAIATIRGMALVSELGIAVRAEGSKYSAVLGVRTVFANPDDVVQKVLAIPPADVAAGKTDAAKAIAAAAPTSPFAQDVAAGQGGLMVPMAVMGMLAAVAVPAFTSYMQQTAP